MHAAADYSRRYALERVAFGKPIAHHQALAFLIVDMHSAVDAARQLLHEAAWRLDAGRPRADRGDRERGLHRRQRGADPRRRGLHARLP
ncbi:acyl-CoA dehydrogenase family protein, partial [Variovorax sp. CT11-76]